MSFATRHAAVLACLTFAGLGISTAQANSLIVYKLGSTASGVSAFSDVVSGLTSSGTFGSNASLTDGSSDYRDAWIDNATNWASVTNIKVGMYDESGNEVAYLNFAGPNSVQGAGVSLSSFFSPADLASSNYTDIPTSPFTGNIFSAAGGDRRYFYVNNNYGGCPADVGWFAVVANFGYPCPWESSTTNANGRAFLYALGNVRQNWTSGQIGEANVFAVTITSDLAPAGVPEPATIVLVGAGLATVRLLRRRRT